MLNVFDRRFAHFAICAALALALAASAAAQTTPTPGMARYVADLRPLNQAAGGGAEGQARLTRQGDQLVIEVDAKGLAEGMHLMHYHGFLDERPAKCPTAAQDVNKDGVVDLIETTAVSGQTLVPFHDSPSSLAIKSETYPKAGADGRVTYRQTVDVKALEAQLKKQYGIDKMSLANRVVYIHGVPRGAELPDTARSLPGVPAQVTLPVACGVLQEQRS